MDSKYFFFETEDSSPTLSLSADLKSEKMHNLKGAFGESVYLYGEAVILVIDKNWKSSFLSVGLGLGYIEMILASILILNKQDLYLLESFELDDNLKQYFVSWLKCEAVPEDFQKAYDKIANLCGKKYLVKTSEIKSFLLNSQNQKKWILNGALNLETEGQNKFSAILYDPFSKDTDGYLWDEGFLKPFINEASANNCVFSSYAALGSLKRALQANNFLIKKRDGFGGKRECTFAVKIDLA